MSGGDVLAQSQVSLGDDFKIVSVFNAQLGSIVDTCIASVYGACEEAHIFPCFGLWEMSSRLSPYSALSLVRQWIHAVRQYTRLSGIYFSAYG